MRFHRFGKGERFGAIGEQSSVASELARALGVRGALGGRTSVRGRGSAPPRSWPSFMMAVRSPTQQALRPSTRFWRDQVRSLSGARRGMGVFAGGEPLVRAPDDDSTHIRGPHERPNVPGRESDGGRLPRAFWRTHARSQTRAARLQRVHARTERVREHRDQRARRPWRSLAGRAGHAHSPERARGLLPPNPRALLSDDLGCGLRHRCRAQGGRRPGPASIVGARLRGVRGFARHGSARSRTHSGRARCEANSDCNRPTFFTENQEVGTRGPSRTGAHHGRKLAASHSAALPRNLFGCRSGSYAFRQVMAHPADSASKAAAEFSQARMTPEQADHLAAMFRPSWELDEAPFTGPGSLSEAELLALQGGGTSAEVRAQAHITNGAHPTSGVVDRTVLAGQFEAPQAAPSPAPILAPAPAQAPHGPMGTVVLPPDQAPKPRAAPSQRPASRMAPVPAPAMARARPAPVEEPVVPKRSKGLWVGIGAVAVGMLGGGLWLLVSGPSETPAAVAPSATEKPTNDRLSAVPPPPPATAAATAPPPATATAQAVAAATTAAAVAPTPQPTAAPVPIPTHAPPPRLHQPVTPLRETGEPPRQGGRKSGQTIVRDVPF